MRDGYGEMGSEDALHGGQLYGRGKHTAEVRPTSATMRQGKFISSVLPFHSGLKFRHQKRLKSINLSVLPLCLGLKFRHQNQLKSIMNFTSKQRNYQLATLGN